MIFFGQSSLIKSGLWAVITRAPGQASSDFKSALWPTKSSPAGGKLKPGATALGQQRITDNLNHRRAFCRKRLFDCRVDLFGFLGLIPFGAAKFCIAGKIGVT